jgi:ribosomal protein L11 methyltransferase
MTSTIAPSTHRASFAIGDEATARRVADLLTESFFEGQDKLCSLLTPARINA